MSEIKAIASYYAGRIFLWKWLSRSPDCILQNLVISYFTKNDTQWRKHCTMLILKVFLPLSYTIDMRNSKETNLGNHRNHVTFLKELRLDSLHDTYILISGRWWSFYTSDFKISPTIWLICRLIIDATSLRNRRRTENERRIWKIWQKL